MTPGASISNNYQIESCPYCGTVHATNFICDAMMEAHSLGLVSTPAAPSMTIETGCKHMTGVPGTYNVSAIYACPFCTIEDLQAKLAAAEAAEKEHGAYSRERFLALHEKLEAAERRITGLVAALESIAANTCCDRCQEAALVARAALNPDSGSKHD